MGPHSQHLLLVRSLFWPLRLEFCVVSDVTLAILSFQPYLLAGKSRGHLYPLFVFFLTSSLIAFLKPSKGWWTKDHHLKNHVAFSAKSTDNNTQNN